MLVPSCGFKKTLESARRQRIFGMMIVDYHTAAVRVAINPLASFSSPVFKAILFKCADKVSDRSVLQLADHRETATAGSSMTPILSEGLGSSSPASSMS
jgi:hypothetical protein